MTTPDFMFDNYDSSFADFLADADALMGECDAIIEDFDAETEKLLATFPVI